MFSLLRSRPLRSALLASILALGGLFAVEAPAHAAIAFECKTTTISCISFSGYAGKSVWGYPVNSSGNNCVNYAAYRLAKNGVANPGNLGNGGAWAANARAKGFRVDQTPAVGSIAEWNYGSYYAPSSGHVAYVEEVTSSYIAFSDSNWSGTSRRWTVTKGDPNYPSNFIHFKDQAYQPPPSGTFIRVRETKQILRLVGKTPVYVSTWNAFGGPKPWIAVSATSLATLPTKITNGAFVQGGQTHEIYRVAGGAPIYVKSWSSVGGPQRYTTIDQVAIDRAATGGVYNRVNKVPATTTYVGARASTTAPVEIYAVAQGKAALLTSWASVGGAKPWTLVDRAALVHAGEAGKWSHVLAVTPDL